MKQVKLYIMILFFISVAYFYTINNGVNQNDTYYNNKPNKNFHLIEQDQSNNNTTIDTTNKNSFQKKAPQQNLEEELSPFDMKIRKSKLLQKEFSKRAYIELPNMNDYVFNDYSQDKVAILAGTNLMGDTLTVLATRMIINPQNLESILSENPEMFPISDPNALSPGYQRALNLNREMNGFSEVNILKKEQNGKTFAVFYAPRKDGKGSYGIRLEGETKKIMGNYDYYEQKFSKFKALGE